MSGRQGPLSALSCVILSSPEADEESGAEGTTHGSALQGAPPQILRFAQNDRRSPYATTLRRLPVISNVAGSIPIGSPSISISTVASERASIRRALA